MTRKAFHKEDISNRTFLITGGAGFIGSNLVHYLMEHGAGEVRVLDNLSEGKRLNIEQFLADDRFHFIEADITNAQVCRDACEGVDHISHQAALGSVPRSVETPLDTNAANVTGFLNMLTAAKDARVARFVYASSSSVYGDSRKLPKLEAEIGRPLSPYAASKYVNEVYASVYALNYGMQTVGLRYFNIFGPNQKPDGPYAAVIPLFIDALLKNEAPFINGDGEQSRDFTFVENAVQANVRAMFAPLDSDAEVFNIACGDRITINGLFEELKSLLHSDLEPVHRAPRKGDIRDSLADISKASELLDYDPQVKLSEGLKVTLEWFREHHGPSH